MLDQSSLTTYGQNKQGVAEVIRAVQEFLERRGRGIAAETTRGLLIRLAEDRFNLVVVGQFKRGKSSLVNALIGEELLPTAVVPLTSIVTALHHGAEKRILVRREGAVPPMPAPVSALADYVTEQGNPNNEKQVSTVEVEVPSSFLRRGLYLIDTPGVGSAHQENTATTYAFLPEADAVIFVTSVESPLTEAELSFLDTVRQYTQRMFVVLNKVDQVGPEDLDETIRYAEQLIQVHLGSEFLGIFPLSARVGLTAKRRVDLALLSQSGVPALEQALGDFLATERGQVLLLSILDRTQRILDEEQYLVDLASGNRNQTGSSSVADVVGELSRERERIIEAMRSAMRRSSDGVIEPLLREFATQVRLGLGAGTDAARTRGELRQSLTAHGVRFLTEKRTVWEDAGRQVLNPAVTELDANVRNSDESFASLGLVISDAPPPFSVDTHGVEFGLTMGEDDNLRLFLPPPFGEWAHRRSLRRAFEADCDQLTDRLRQSIRYYLEGIIQQVELRSSRLIDEVGRTGQPSNASVAGHIGSAPGTTVEDTNETLRNLRERISRLRAAIPVKPEIEPENETLTEGDEETTDSTVNAFSKTQDQSIENLLRVPTCPVCRAVTDTTYDFLRHFQYALATDEATRRTHRARGGFCSRHTWALESVASPRGLSTGYPLLVDRLADEVAGLIGLPSAVAAERLRDVLPNSRTCSLCTIQRRRTEQAIRDFAAYLGTEDSRAAYRGSSGMCLPHLTAALALNLPNDVATLLVSVSARHFEDVSSAMRGYVVKIDARRRDLITREEDWVSLRATILLAGEKGVNSS